MAKMMTHTPPLGERPRRIRRTTGRVTLTDVARLADVSPQTVSRVLNIPEQVAPLTVAHVRRAIEAAGYRPPAAETQAAERSRLVAVLVPTITGTVFGEMVVALNRSLARNGYQMMLGESGYDDADEQALLDNLIRRRPDGVVIARIVQSAAARERLRASGIAVVEVFDLTPTPVDMLIGFSHAEIGAEVAGYFQSQGRRCPGLIVADDARALQRAKAFTEAIARLRRPATGSGARPRGVPSVTIPAPASLGGGRSALAELLEACPQLDAVFCSTDMAALGVLIEAGKRGIRVPEQLAVIGFGDTVFASQTEPPLTTIRVDGTAIGQQAAQFIMQRVAGVAVERPVVDIGFALVRRGSA